MDMLKRAARAALDEFRLHLEELAPGAEDDIAQRVVRAVLTAIREPSIAVVMAGANEVENGDGELHRRKWQAMIDAILRDQ